MPVEAVALMVEPVMVQMVVREEQEEAVMV